MATTTYHGAKEQQQGSSSSVIKLDKIKAEQINLSVIQRLDSDVEQVIATAGHVALYDFDVSSSQWSRKDVEGSLFLVKRRGSPRFRFVILNKKGDDNFWEDVGQNFSCEQQDPYVMYRNGPGGGVIGIWFYEQEDCQKFAELFEKIATTFAAPSDASIDVGNNGNALAQVFAGIKVASQQPQPAPPQGLPLLTPQHFVHSNPTRNDQGAALLQSLHSSAVGDTKADRSAKVQALLQSLANNKVFCDILQEEMGKAGLFS